MSQSTTWNGEAKALGLGPIIGVVFAVTLMPEEAGR